MKLAFKFHVLKNHVQNCEHYTNEIQELLEQSPEVFESENSNAILASQ